MKELGRYCTETQMFVREPVDPSINYLVHLRKVAETGAFGYLPYSIPRGENLFRLNNKIIKEYAMQEADKTSDQKLTQYIAANGDY